MPPNKRQFIVNIFDDQIGLVTRFISRRREGAKRYSEIDFFAIRCLLGVYVFNHAQIFRFFK